MIVYICAMLLSIMFAAISKNRIKAYSLSDSKYIKINNERSSYTIDKYTFIALSFLPLFFVSAFRFNVGKDYNGTYRIGFNTISSGRDYKNFEIGFKLINKFVLIFTKDYAGLFIITAFLFCFFTYKAIYSQSPSPTFSLFLLVTSGFYFYSMNAIRQCIATSIFLYAIQYIEKKDFKKYLFWILIASTVHLIALIYLPFYFIGRLVLPFVKTVLLLGISAAILPFLKKIIYYIISLTKYSAYIGSKYDTNKNGIIIPTINFAIIIFAYYYLYLGKKNKDFNNTKYRIFLNMQIVAAIFSLCFGLFPLAPRLFFAFFYGQIFLVPMAVAQEKDQNIKLVIELAIVIIYFVYFLYTVGIKNANTVLPYQTIFDR